MKTNVLLIGAGNIAGAKPMAKKDGPIVTHIQAILADDRMDLVGVVDSDLQAACNLVNRWGLNKAGIFKNVKDVRFVLGGIAAGIDLVVIATPPATHLQIVRDVFEHLSPEAILLEKPGGTTLQEAFEIDHLCATNDCNLYLNYQRNYASEINPAMIELNIGKVQSARCDYVRGLRNDASHAIALFQKLFGTASIFNGKPVAFGGAIDDLPGDKTITAVYSLPRCPTVILAGNDGRFFDLFEITIYGERGTISFENHGQSIIFNGISDEDVYGSYKKMKHTRIKIGDANLSLSNVYNAILDCGYCGRLVDYVNIWHTISQIESAFTKSN